jgi:ribosomal protection tetracycline resistance protein
VPTLNLGILAHVDAGKTTLTERLLHAAGVIDEIGSVDDGSTQTDTLDLERRRGITIKSAVVAFMIGDVAVNLIDTPGHPDFIAEVERVLSVLDGAVLVVSAVEGVQAQTRVLMRALERSGVPTLIFVNKTDRAGARREPVLRAIREKLSPAIVPADVPGERALFEALAEHDDALLAAYVDDAAEVPAADLHRALAAQTARGRVHPLFFGSARTGAGVAALMAGIAELLPAAGGDADGPVAGVVFKIERGAGGEKVAYVRMRAGTIRTRDRLHLGAGGTGKVTAIEVFEGGGAVRSESVTAGRIAKLWGLADARIGDAVGASPPPVAEHHFQPPTLETVVVPRRAADRRALRVALGRLAEQDPLIGLRFDAARQELALSLYGEVQKEVIEATLADEFGIGVVFRATTTICIERPVGSGAAAEVIDTDGNPFLATVGLRVDPAPAGAGIEFRLEVELGSMPFAFFRAVEETVRETLGRGGLHGWRVADAVVTMTHSGYAARQSHAHGVFDRSMSSTAGDFRALTPIVLMRALERAGTVVLEPLHRFELEVPADTLAGLLPVLGRLGAVAGAPAPDGASYRLEGEIPAARVHELRRRLPGLTRGEGVLESAFERYERVRGAVPTRGPAPAGKMAS